MVTFDRPGEIVASLRALADQEVRLDHLVVVNNGEPGDLDSLDHEVRRAARSTQVIDVGDNIGPAGGIAVGMRWVLTRARECDVVMLLDDDDPLPDERVVSEIVGALCSGRLADPKLAGIAIRGATIDRHTGRLSGATAPSGASCSVDYLKSGWAATYTVESIRNAGVFDESLFFGFDDLEFGLRLTAKGFNLEVHTFDRELQPAGPSISLVFARSPWRSYYATRNLYVIYRRYGMRWAALRTILGMGVAKPVLNLAAHPIEGRKSAIMAWRGAWDGVRGRAGRRVEPSHAKHWSRSLA